MKCLGADVRSHPWRRRYAAPQDEGGARPNPGEIVILNSRKADERGVIRPTTAPSLHTVAAAKISREAILNS